MHRNARSVGCLAIILGSLSTLVSCKSPMAASNEQRLPAIPTTRPGVVYNEPPPAAREFRAAWVATVGNIDWPSKPGLTTQQQQDEIIKILDRAKAINLNAIVLQVRTTADALYDSKLEPWSAFLTGTQGKAPDPYYDPLKFWIDESHKRGIELHAWFNPFRTHYEGSKVVAAASHVSKTHPEYTHNYGKLGWMDPGEQAAQDHSFAVFMDVVERYDVDGIHIDDYFYPYPEKLHPDDDDDDRLIPFPDDASYKKYTDGGGKLNRADWRRQNITTLIKRIYAGIKARKPNVKFGISPFGIPRPGLEGIEYVKGFDQYEKLYADIPLWLSKGWCDYVVPQLYWKTGSPGQPFLGLAQWWADHNPKGRNIYAGLFTSRVDWSDESWANSELYGQIMITRLLPGIGGQVHFSMICLDQNRMGLAEDLRDGLYAKPALAPASPWLDKTVPAAPIEVAVERIPGIGVKPPWKKSTTKPTTKTTKPAKKEEQKSVAPMKNPPATKPFYPLTIWKTKPMPWLASEKVTWTPAPGAETPFLYVVYYQINDVWSYKIVPGDVHEFTVLDSDLGGPATRVSVSAVSRIGNESKRTTLVTGYEKPKKPTTRHAGSATTQAAR